MLVNWLLVLNSVFRVLFVFSLTLATDHAMIRLRHGESHGAPPSMVKNNNRWVDYEMGDIVFYEGSGKGPLNPPKGDFTYM